MQEVPDMSVEQAPLEGSDVSSQVEATPSEMDEHDSHVAQAAFFLWMEHYEFQWEQMTENQQNLYHGMIGRYLQSMHNDDD